MQASNLLRRILKSISLYVAAHGAAGCATAPYRMWVDPASPAGMPAQMEPFRPPDEQAKPIDASQESDERHPSRWRQKLKTRYS